MQGWRRQLRTPPRGNGQHLLFGRPHSQKTKNTKKDDKHLQQDQNCHLTPQPAATEQCILSTAYRREGQACPSFSSSNRHSTPGGGGDEPITFHQEVNCFAAPAKWNEARGKRSSQVGQLRGLLQTHPPQASAHPRGSAGPQTRVLGAGQKHSPHPAPGGGSAPLILSSQPQMEVLVSEGRGHTSNIIR